MDQPARKQIRLILDDASDRLKRAVDDRLNERHGGYGEDAALRSILAATEAIEEETGTHIAASVDRVSAVAKDAEAFVMINENLEISLTFLSNKLDGVFRALFDFWGQENRIAVRKEMLSRLSESQGRLRRQLELHRFMFITRHPSPVIDSVGEISSAGAAKLKGGKPLAAHWDQMWAAIAVALHTGDLKPKTQADIERAMKDWLASKDFDAGDTAVRTRARELWRALEESE